MGTQCESVMKRASNSANVTENSPLSERPMLGALLTEIAIRISRVTLIQERHLIAVSHHAGEKARREALTQLGKQH